MYLPEFAKTQLPGFKLKIQLPGYSDIQFPGCWEIQLQDAQKYNTQSIQN